MKIIASIPVEKISGNGFFSFRHEQHEVEVVRVIRHQATRNPDQHRYRRRSNLPLAPGAQRQPNGIIATLAGGPVGIVAAMWAHPKIKSWWAR